MNEIIRDSLSDHKLWFAVFAIVVVVGSAFGGMAWPAFQPMYTTLVGGVIAVAGMFLTGHVAQKWIGLKAPSTPEPLEDDPVEAPAAPPEPRFTE